MSVTVCTGGVELGSGPAVVFLHGAGLDHTVWRFQTRWLAHRGWRVLAPDLPGHGGSGGRPRATIEEWAAWLSEFLGHALEGAAATVVGHSMGSFMALHAAAERPLLFERLVLLGVAPAMSVHPALLRAAADDLDEAAALFAGWSMPGAWRGGHPEPGTWQQGATESLVARSRPGTLAADLSACAAYDATAAGSQLQVPAVIVSGSADRMVPPAGAHRLADIVPGSRLLILDGAGHDPMLQMPGRFNRLLAEILSGDGKAVAN